MHHLKQFPNYPTQKKVHLVIALLIKFVVFGAVFAGLIFLLKGVVSTGVLIALTHLIVFACVIVFLLMHKRLSHSHDAKSK
jgi:hypothetical protein